MAKKLLIKVKSLKEFLALFDNDNYLENLSLGDTWHPSSGFVDESILDGKRKVGDILAFDYDFEGLIGFEAQIGDVDVKLLEPSDNGELEPYEVRGAEKNLRNLYNKCIEKNAYYPDIYRVCFMNNWN